MPRSKAPKAIWIVCDNCGLTFCSKNEKKHSDICTTDKHFDPENIAQSSDLAYGFLKHNVLVGVVVVNNGK